MLPGLPPTHLMLFGHPFSWPEAGMAAIRNTPTVNATKAMFGRQIDLFFITYLLSLR
jgi:hypothetical protein